MISQLGQLTYFLSEKEVVSQKSVILLISLAGPINRSNAAVLDKLIEELEKRSPGWVVLNLRDVGSSIERTQYPAFAKLQKTVRDKGAELKICSVHPNLRTTLVDAGLLRVNEITNNLPEALQSLAPKQAPGTSEK
ncbi:MAG: STAS domain-containing protein [Bdellovibrionia bacterium]